MARGFRKNDVTFVDNTVVAISAHEQIATAMLTASAQVVVDRAKGITQHGFRSGMFVTDGWTKINFQIVGRGLGSGNIRAEVGHPDPHFMYWEMGHQNAFTRRYERFEWLKMAQQQTVAQQRTAAARAATAAAARYGVGGFMLYSVAKRGRGAPRRTGSAFGPRPR